MGAVAAPLRTPPFEFKLIRAAALRTDAGFSVQAVWLESLHSAFHPAFSRRFIFVRKPSCRDASAFLPRPRPFPLSSESYRTFEFFQGSRSDRNGNVGDAIHLRGLIELSNYCRRNCLYCGLRRSNGNLIRYRMALHEIFSFSREVEECF